MSFYLSKLVTKIFRILETKFSAPSAQKALRVSIVKNFSAPSAQNALVLLSDKSFSPRFARKKERGWGMLEVVIFSELSFLLVGTTVSPVRVEFNYCQTYFALTVHFFARVDQRTCTCSKCLYVQEV